MKKIVSLLLTLCLCSSLIPLGGFTFTVSAYSTGGFTYSLGANNEAEITGTSIPFNGDLTIPSSLGPYTVTGIDFFAFENQTGITSITIPDSVTTIEQGAFYNCINLEKITLPDNTSLGVAVFDGTAYYNEPSNWENDALYIGSHLIEVKNCVEGNYAIKNGTKTIEDSAFYYCRDLTGVTIPDTVTHICRMAFARCESLTSITVPNSVVSIGKYAFEDCKALIDINLPSNVKSIGEYAFYGTDYYNDISKWENRVLYIGNHLIEAKSYITGDYTIKEGTKTIADKAFYECESLENINIPNSVTAIGYETFYKCKSLEQVEIPSEVTNIGRRCFYECSGLTSLTISDSFTQIRDLDVFYKCKIKNLTIAEGSKVIVEGMIMCEETLEEVIIPLGITNIGDRAFWRCRKLKSVIIPNSVKSIGDLAFSETALNNIEIPDNVVSIGENAFDYTAYYRTSSNWENGILYIGNHLIAAEGYIAGDYAIKEGTKTIADSAFYYCHDLTGVTIPNTVTHIGKSAFERCENLTNITIPDSVLYIGDNAFRCCSSLNRMSIGKNVKYIGTSVLGSVRLSSIQVSPDNEYYLSENGILFNKDKTEIIRFSALKFDNSNYTIPNSVTHIAASAFDSCYSLTNVIIPESVTSIGAGAFSRCDSLEIITIPDSVTNIGESAFSNCYSLTSVTLPNNITTISNWTFDSCEVLTSITIPESVTSIGAGAFDGCENLISVTVPEGVINIGDHAFSRCFNLTSITIPKALMYWGYLEYCDNLTDVWYGGNKEDKNWIVSYYNDAFNNAEWHYSICSNEHSYKGACDTSCELCEFTRSTNTTHNFSNATCTKPQICKVCEATIGNKLGHNYDSGKITTKATCKTTGVKTYVCTVCGTAKSESVPKLTMHTYTTVCDTNCNICGIVRQITHTYSGNCDTNCNVCGAARTVTHTYGTATTKATLSKNGSIVKKCAVCGDVESNNAINLVRSITLSNTEYTYNGSIKKPTVTVKDSLGKKLKNGTDYTVSYAKGRKNVGAYKVTVTLKGNYSGKKVLTFKINPPKSSIKKLTAAKKSLKVSISKKTKEVTGYEIQYSTSKKFKSAKKVTIKKAKTTNATIKKLKAKKTYYVRVRTYKTVKGKKYYSVWSGYKSKKTK